MTFSIHIQGHNNGNFQGTYDEEIGAAKLVAGQVVRALQDAGLYVSYANVNGQAVFTVNPVLSGV